ncbi:MAG TPA: hypothetical protein VIS05_09480 [Ilumatobacter sp.]
MTDRLAARTLGGASDGASGGMSGAVVSKLPVAVRRGAARHPWLQWVTIAVLGGGVAWSVQSHVAAVDAQRQAWGATRVVAVAARGADVGEPVAVVGREVPVALVPDGAVSGAPPPGGWVARQRLTAGEIVTGVDIASGDGPWALTPPGWLGVPVVESPRSGAPVGTPVAVASGGLVLSGEALVVARHDEVTVVAVPSQAAPGVAAASNAGDLTLLLHP